MVRRIIIFMAILSAAVFTGCRKEDAARIEKEYILFSDTLSVNAVQYGDGYSFNVPVTSTVACDHDRTFAVEIVDKGSNAVEGRDYRLRSNTVTIPAGRLSANVEVFPEYDRFGNTDTLSFNLRLVVPDELKWDLYGDMTKVSMVKVCPFSLETFSGYCVVTSLFLQSYPGNNTSISRLIETEPVEGKENTILMKDWLFDGYDVELTFDPSDPLHPVVSMPSGVISDEMSVFGQMHGDNLIKAESSSAYISYFNSCQKFVSLWIRAYVDDMNTPFGNIGHFYNVMEWISDEEAESLKKEEGL